MIVGIDARLAILRGRGWGRYAVELLRRLGDHPEVTSRVLLPDTESARDLAVGLQPNVQCILTPFGLSSGDDYLCDSMNGRDPVDLLDSVDVLHVLTRFAAATRFPAVVATVHDVAPLVDPPFKSEIRESSLRAMERLVMNNWHLIAVSETTRRELIQYCGVNDAMVHVIPLGADALDFGAPTAPFQQQQTKNDPFILLYVGGAGDNKNLERLIDAVEQLNVHVAVQLWLVGAWEWGYAERLDGNHLSDKSNALIDYRGLVGDQHLRDLYRQADVLVFPSLHEGFGLPVVEAMRLGLPVCCSDIPIMHEVAGDSALFFNPYDPSSMASAIRQTLMYPKATIARAREGYQRARTFRWERTVQETVQVYTEVSSAMNNPARARPHEAC